MTQEQKARAYDKVREKIALRFGSNVAEEIFSEFEMSEDEQHRKWIIEYLYDGLRRSDEQFKDQFKCAIAWLERQGENKEINEASYRTGIKRVLDNPESYGLKRQSENKTVIEMKSPEESLGISSKEYNEIVNNCIYSESKPADNIKTKFNVGNWYQCTKDFFGKGVTFDKNTAYYCAEEGCLQDEYGCHIAIVKDLYDNFKLWTIQDTKPGDVLVHNGCTFIFMGIKNGIVQALEENLLEGTNPVCFGEPNKDGDYHPATKEQRDNLFAKMHEAGYMWDSKSKQLLSLKAEPSNIQTSTWWSHEDDVMVHDILGLLPVKTRPEYNQRREDWLKSIKGRVQPKSTAWSEEDEKRINRISDFIWKNRKGDTDEIYQQEQDANWLKSIKGRVQSKPAEWSEEDESMYTRTLGILGKCYMGELPTKVEDELKWFKSRLKCFRPQRQWKPSDEQMEALKTSYLYWKGVTKEIPYSERLESLYKQLKKLTE